LTRSPTSSAPTKSTKTPSAVAVVNPSTVAVVAEAAVCVTRYDDVAPAAIVLSAAVPIEAPIWFEVLDIAEVTPVSPAGTTGRMFGQAGQAQRRCGGYSVRRSQTVQSARPNAPN